MKSILSSLILFSFMLSVSAKPGGTYALTGKESSIFGIFQADMKAFPELYEGEDVNEYYSRFKAVNDLEGDRKLQLGEELKFPHTDKSKEIAEAELVAAEEKARKEARIAARKAARLAEQEAQARRPSDNESSTNQTDSGYGELFGSDMPGAYEAELKQQRARTRAVNRFEQSWLPGWLFSRKIAQLTDEHMAELVQVAAGEVDERFAQAMKLHCFPDQKICIIEFETPAGQEEYFFFAIMESESGSVDYYALEKGLSFFGAGQESKLVKWRSVWSATDVGARDYSDLKSFMSDITRDG